MEFDILNAPVTGVKNVLWRVDVKNVRLEGKLLCLLLALEKSC